MRAYHHAVDVRRMASHALANGGTVVTPGHVHWDISQGCDDPHWVEQDGRHTEVWGQDEFGEPLLTSQFMRNAVPMTDVPGVRLTLDLPCRKCPPCLKRRARFWALRCQAEIHAAPRTWFGTLTATPDAHVLHEYRAAVAAEKRGVELLADGDELFRRSASQFGSEVTKWLKRIRKETGAPLRYCLVAEAHKSGRPHMHILLHEVDRQQPVRWETLNRQWRIGFSQFKLTEDTASAWYVCKYLSKAALARVRASKAYGKLNALSIDETERVKF